MRQYARNKDCPRCGYHSVSTQFNYFPSWPTSGNNLPNVGCDEPYLRRVCLKCGYTWHEAPLDTPAAGTLPEEA